LQVFQPYRIFISRSGDVAEISAIQIIINCSGDSDFEQVSKSGSGTPRAPNEHQ